MLISNVVWRSMTAAHQRRDIRGRGNDAQAAISALSLVSINSGCGEA